MLTFNNKEILYSLNQNAITSKGSKELFNTLKECNSKVSFIFLNYNKMDDDCMESLSLYIQNNEHILSLSLAHNNIGDKGIDILSEYMAGNTTLSILGLEYNNDITDASFPFLVDIATKSHVHRINLTNTSVSEERKEEINNYLKVRKEMRHIPVKSSAKSAAKGEQ